MTRATRSEREVALLVGPDDEPAVHLRSAGKSPMGMDLVPVYDDEVAAGAAVTIDPVIVQNMGVRVATVTEGPLRATVRAVG